MFRWLSRKQKDSKPSYSLLKESPSRGLPQELADREASADFGQWRDRIEADLDVQEEVPHLVTFLEAGNGLLCVPIPQSERRCLLAFSSPRRAADYAKVQAPGQTFQFLCSSAREVVLVIKEFCERGGISDVALDRCPRCDIFCMVKASGLDSAAKVVGLWKISKAAEIARARLYWDYARSAARSGQLLVARDVALELVGHVTAEDPRSHLLLGKLAIQLRDKRLLREAKEFLAFIRQDWAIGELQSAEKTRAIEF